jgi:hypothetical protein
VGRCDQYERSALLANLLKKMTHRSKEVLMLQALKRWKSVIDWVNKRRALISVNVTAKRVTVHWFLQWYWDAYDIEIKSSLQMLMGTCDEAMGDLYEPRLGGGEYKDNQISKSSIFEQWGQIGESLQTLSMQEVRGLNQCMKRAFQNQNKPRMFLITA